MAPCSHLMQGLERLFVRLAQLPSATWQPHLTALVERLSHVVDASEFLSDIWAAPPETDAPAVQVTALHLWTELSAQPHGTSPTKASKGRKAAPPTPPGAAGPVALLPRLLGLLGHVEPTLRAAAARSAGVLAESIDAWWEEGAAADGLDKATAAAVLGGIGANAGSIEADTEAAEALLRRSLELSGAEVVAPATARKARSAAGRKKQTEGGAGSTAPHLGLSDTQAAAFGAYLLASIPKQSSDAGLASVPFAIGVVHDWAPPQEVLLAAHRLLRAFALEGSPPALRALASQLNRRVASELLTVFNDASLATLLHAGGQDAADVVESLCAMMAVPGPTGSAVVRKKALTCITPTVFTALPDEAQRTIFKVRMRTYI